MLSSAIEWLLHAKDSFSNELLSVPVIFFASFGIIFFVILLLYAFKKKN